jgi:hypothetical protein
MIEHTSELAHDHPMADGRQFNHVHRVDPAVRANHQALMLGLAHPELADVEQAPEPGSPADLRRAATELRERAAHFRDQADRCEHEAAKLEAQATRDEQSPPDTSERLRRLLEGGLG